VAAILTIIDKNLLLFVGSIRNVHLCVKNILPQDVVYSTNDHTEGKFRHHFFEEKFSPFGCVTRKTGISTGIQADISGAP